MRVSAKADYAIRAVVELAARRMAAGEGGGDGAAVPAPVKGDVIAAAQHIPLKYCENILAELRSAGVVASRRGAEGGYWMHADPATVRLGDLVRIVEGPLAAVRGMRPNDVTFDGPAQGLQQVWVATRAALRRVLDEVTVADVVTGQLPAAVGELLDDPGAWDAVTVQIADPDAAPGA